MSYSKRGFAISLFLSICYAILEYLEVLNLYNCERWYCGGVAMGVWLLTALNALVHRQNFDLDAPVLLVHFMCGGGLLFWDVEWWNVNTRHRTEYYDTHDTYFALLFVVILIAIHRFRDEARREAIDNIITVCREATQPDSEHPHIINVKSLEPRSDSSLSEPKNMNPELPESIQESSGSSSPFAEV